MEDDRTPTGLHVEHQQLVGLSGLSGLVAARTSPSLAVMATPVQLGTVTVGHIAVPKAQGEVVTTSGLYLRRRLKADGQPECVAMLPHDRASRVSSCGPMGTCSPSASSTPRPAAYPAKG